jgi:hypothetical protein
MNQRTDVAITNAPQDKIPYAKCFLFVARPHAVPPKIETGQIRHEAMKNISESSSLPSHQYPAYTGEDESD